MWSRIKAAGRWVDSYRVTVTYGGFVVLAIMIIGVAYQNKNTDTRQDRSIIKLEKTPCGKDPNSVMCAVHFNESIQGALSHKSACTIVNRARVPGLKCVSTAVERKQTRSDARDTNNAKGLPNDQSSSTSTGTDNSGSTGTQPPSNGGSGGSDGSTPPSSGGGSTDPGTGGTSNPPSSPPTSSSPSGLLNQTVETVQGIACPVTGALGLGGVTNPVIGC